MCCLFHHIRALSLETEPYHYSRVLLQVTAHLLVPMHYCMLEVTKLYLSENALEDPDREAFAASWEESRSVYLGLCEGIASVVASTWVLSIIGQHPD